MKIEIKHRATKEVIFEVNADSLKEAVEIAVANSICLRNANFSNADLRYSDLRYSDLNSANLRNADLRYSDLRYSDLRDSDLRNADLRHADLRHADLDFSCWPLWCGSLDVKLDIKQKRQLLYHLLAVAPEYRTKKLLIEANKFHRIPEVPELKQATA